jgi:hypothetical protein
VVKEEFWKVAQERLRERIKRALWTVIAVSGYWETIHTTVSFKDGN